MSWDLYREMWGSHGEFAIDGNLKSVEYTDRLVSIRTPTLLLVGDHDECAPALSETMHEKIAGSKLVILPKSWHMTFVDQSGMFVKTVDDFLEEANGSLRPGGVEGHTGKKQRLQNQAARPVGG
jgi:pimeloyl-ACP methyl ester carboxylesterase